MLYGSGSKYIFPALFACFLWTSSAHAQQIRFSEVAVPTSEDAKKQIITSPRLFQKSGKNEKVQKSGKNEKEIEISYQAILESGQSYGDNRIRAIFGKLIDKDNKPLVHFENVDKAAISHKNDFTSILQKNKRLFAVTHFEHGPAALYLSELDNLDGTFKAVSTQPIKIPKDGDNVWYPCAGVVTDWQTHLGAEEFPIDGKFFQSVIDSGKTEKFHHKYHIPSFRYFHRFRVRDPETGDTDTKNLPATGIIKDNFNPYRHGYVFEVSVEAAAGVAPSATVKKHYAMGRFSHEVAYVMPDNKTVYMTDDDGDGKGGFFMFIADTPKDFSAGTLYAARWKPDGWLGRIGAGIGDLEWISLGHSSRDDLARIERALGRNGGQALTFKDIFKDGEPKENRCKPGYFATNQGKTGSECLKLRKSVSEAVVSRLETRRYAALKGATLEFSKSEGLAYDPKEKKLFMAVAEISGGMREQGKDWRPQMARADNREHIRLKANPCGAVYTLDIGPDARYGSHYVARNMYELITGREKPYPASSPFGKNTCDVDAIAGPDNLTFLPEYRTLIIAEDTSRHENNFVWAYNVETRKLTRIQSMPKGGEATSVYYHRDIGGKGYIVSVLQHPGKTEKTGETAEGESVNMPATVGLIGPIPVPDGG